MILVVAVLIVETDYTVLLYPIMTATYERYTDVTHPTKGLGQKMKQFRKLMTCQIFGMLSIASHMMTILQYTATLVEFRNFFAVNYWMHPFTTACNTVKALPYFDLYMARVSSALFLALIPLALALTSE